MGMVSGRAWLSALALAVGAAPAFAQGEPAQMDPMTVRRVADVAGDPRLVLSPQSFDSHATVELNGRLYFLSGAPRPDGGTVNELWVTDGTAAGTRSLREWLPPSTRIDLGSLRATSHRLFFTATTDETGRELWTSDGTREGTHLTRELSPGQAHGMSLQAPVIALGDVVLFAPSGTGTTEFDLWKSDGTEAGTVPVKDIAQGPASLLTTGFVRAGDTVFFGALGPAGDELWRTDGTAAGTWMVRDLQPGLDSAFPRELTAVGRTLYFAAQNDRMGHSLWKTDGTTEGTVLVAEFPRPDAGNHLFNLTALGDRLFFTTFVPGGVALWRTDGTEASTRPVMIQSSKTFGGTSAQLIPVGHRLYMVSHDTLSGDSLWVTDGSPEGTRRLPSPTPLGREFIRGAAAWEGGLAFIRTTPTGANELWMTDGTLDGTVRQTRLPSGNANVPPTGLVPFQGALLTTAGDAWTPNAVWRLERDEASPTFVCPASRDVPSNNPAGTLTQGLAPVLMTGPVTASVRTTHPDDSMLPLYQPVLVTARAEDATGRLAYCATLMTSRDLTGPAINGCPTQLTMSTRSINGLPFYYPTPNIQDETSREVLVTYSPENGTVLPLGTTQVSMTAKDVAGNVTTCSFPVTIIDGQAPAGACKVNEVRVEAEGPHGAHAWWPEATPTDNISSKVTVTSTHASGDLFPLGLTRVELISTDEAGNSTTCEIQVRVRDSRPPVLTCPEDQTLTTAVMSGTRAEYPEATAADSVSEAELLYSPVVGTPLAPGLHAVQVTAIDKAGNAALCNFHVTVQYDPTSDMRTSMGCSVGSSSESAVGWVALVALAWTLSRRLKDGQPRA
ncbi:flagellar hook-length control protein [Corallococcus coralloides DSM 2259]|uniref:Flagellar hook-length control protein n=1 Tax=Corallococcus coralloides (strain ATCC 25202 / DSM 2259 / NBRC 100086 / M2) TaxID=1144275 RepID=H8MUI8_CORCM|nr:HYR domain-containing protein [Corallococcus coralloides]AFE06968.1 flagellar hook-length control protein [Corallococcus coralloides DSM 2259]